MSEWRAPVPTLKVALGYGRFTDAPGTLDWTDLSDRITGPWTVELPSRTSWRDAFTPGRLTVTLKNDDRMLDPSNPSGLVYAPDGDGLPGAPVTFDLTFDGDTERRFTGWLSSPAWAGSGSPRIAGAAAPKTVTLQAEDWLASSGDLPDTTWACAVMALHPIWYLPMDPPNALLDDDSEVPDRSGKTSSAAVVQVTEPGTARPDGQLGGWYPWLKCSAGTTLTSAAADVMPDGDENNYTVGMWWCANGPHSVGESSTVLRMEHPGTGVPRWEVWVDEDGEAHASVYDSGGTEIGTGMVTRTIVTRWDTTDEHFVLVRITSGNNFRLYFGGDVLDLTSTSTLYESDLICGPSDLDTWVDELFVVDRAISDPEVAGLLFTAGEFVGQWFGQSYTERLGSWTEAAGIEGATLVDYSLNWRVPDDDTDFDGFVAINPATVPGTLADAYRQTVGAGGAVVPDRWGFPVTRDATALTSATYAEFYDDLSAHFTDDDSTLTGTDYRHAGATRGAVDMDAVVNRIESTFYLKTDTGAYQQHTFRPESTVQVGGRTSFQQFGRKVLTESTERYGWDAAAARADGIIARAAWPTAGFEMVAYDATGDDRLCTWLMTVECEARIDVTYTPLDGTSVTVEGMHLQGLTITGDTTWIKGALRPFPS